jgi:FkbM family methyltransferase
MRQNRYQFYYDVRTGLKNLYFFVRPKAWLERVARPNRWDEIESFCLAALVDPKLAAIDVGDNVGKYALALSSLVPIVYALEPSEMSNPIRTYFPKNVKVYTVAASDRSGTAQLTVPIFGDRESIGLASIEPDAVTRNYGAYKSVAVSTVTLDELVKEPVGFIKVDVEGHELAVLKGSTRLLAENKPTLLVEAEERHSPGAVEGVRSFLSRLGYAGFFVQNKMLRPIGEFSVDMQNPAEIDKPIRRIEMNYVNNFLFVPAERVGEFTSKMTATLRALPR